LWDYTVYEMRPDAQPYFDGLAAAGIIYSDPAAAAQHVAAIYEHATEWWKSDEIQRVRLTFLNRFGLASRDWQEQWARYLRGLTAS